MDFDPLSHRVIGACIRVHTALGPGLLESVYERCLEHVLCKEGLLVERQMPIDLVFEDLSLPGAFQADLVIERRLIVEVKNVASLGRIHRAQLRTYLKLSDIDVGLLANFNVPSMRDGIRRVTR